MARENTSNSANEAVMVTGGSGFIGQKLVKELAEKQRSVVSIYRHRLPDPSTHVYPVCSDLSSAELLAAPLRGVNTVVHLAWERQGFEKESLLVSKSNRELLQKSGISKNLENLKTLISSMECAGTKRFVFLSTLGATRTTDVSFLKEKYLCESLILNSKIPEKVIIRTGIVFGSGYGSDRFIKSILRLMQYPAFYPIPESKKLLSPLHIEDVVEILFNACFKNLEHGANICEISGSESLSVEEIFKLVHTRYGKGSKFGLKGSLAKTLLPFCERDKIDLKTPKIAFFLAIGSKAKATLSAPSNDQNLIPEKLRSFKEMIRTEK